MASLHHQSCLRGAAVGDAIGLPFEGLRAARAARWAQPALRHRLFFGTGTVSDDTDHSVFVAEALLLARGDVERFRRALAWRLRWWLTSLPAGIGLATLRGIVRLWLGVPPTRSGVWSAGNGAAMRSALIGCHFRADATRRRAFVAASTQMTHRDPLALAGALAVADVAARISHQEWRVPPAPSALAAVLLDCSDAPAWQAAVRQLFEALDSPAPLETARQAFSTPAGVDGFVLRTVPWALAIWHTHHDDYRAALTAAVHAGGDTDTVGAIAGALVGLSAGADAIPAEWWRGLRDWPHGRSRLDALAAALDGRAPAPRLWPSPGLWLRSIWFIPIILAHGVRRLWPR